MNSKISIVTPSFDSDLTNIILDLEKLRTKKLYGSLPSHIFFQLKDIFHILETLGSARIEGNNTTLSEYVEKILEKKEDENSIEILNLEKAIDYIEEFVDENTVFSRKLISELQQILTKDLTPPPKGEGSNNPGDLRLHNVSIKKSGHTPPDVTNLQEHFDNFISFINEERKEQFQLLMVAIAHHRFEYIHPFDNGNGRMGRLLNYAFLIKLGFQVKNGRLINPSSVFYTDRDRYYEMLSKADSLQEEDVLNWCEYFLLGLKNEIEKIDFLLDAKYVRNRILLPTLQYALEYKHIDEQEFKILKHLINTDSFEMKSEELSKFGITNSTAKSRMMAKLRDKGIVKPTTAGGRIYTINFVNNHLLRGVMKTLEDNGFVSDFLNKN